MDSEGNQEISLIRHPPFIPQNRDFLRAPCPSAVFSLTESRSSSKIQNKKTHFPAAKLRSALGIHHARLILKIRFPQYFASRLTPFAFSLSSGRGVKTACFSHDVAHVSAVRITRT